MSPVRDNEHPSGTEHADSASSDSAGAMASHNELRSISNGMSHKHLWVTATIIAFVLIIGFVLSVPHTRDIGNSSSLQNATTSAPSVSLHDSFKKGTHTITGSVKARNACASVSAQASLVGDAANASGILVALSLEKDSGVCLQVPTSINFMTTVSAPARLPITATVNGEVATTTAL